MKNLHRRLLMSGLLSMLVLLTACAPTIPRSYVVLLPDLDGAVGEVIVSGQKGRQVLTRSGQIAGIDGVAVKAEMSEAQLTTDFSAAKSALPLRPEHFMLYFISGSTRMTAESETNFGEILNRWKSRGVDTVVEVAVIGHTDTVGKDEDNLVLSAERAKLVANRLRASGLKFSSLTMESHGKRNPQVPTKDGVDEPQNRRVQVTIR